MDSVVSYIITSNKAKFYIRTKTRIADLMVVYESFRGGGVEL